MINPYHNITKINVLEDNYFNLISKYVKRRLARSSNKSEIQLIFDAKDINSKTNLTNILIGEPDILSKIIQTKDMVLQHYKTDLEKIFRFDSLRNKYGALLARILNIKTCPYCNEHYIFSFARKNGQKYAPSFDHFFCQSQYPYLALSLYNLIPCCDICNSRLKLDKKFTLDDNLHPYEDDFDNHYCFAVKPKDNFYIQPKEENFDIILEEKNPHTPSTQAKNNKEVFKLEERYKHHKDVVLELLFKMDMYPSDWEKLMGKRFPTLNITSEDALRYYYGGYLNKEKINKRPLTKLLIDIKEGSVKIK